MRTYKKEELDGIIKDIVEHMGAKYPNLPFIIILETSDAQQTCRANSSHLADPNQCMRALSMHINTTANQQIQAFMQSLQLAQNQHLIAAMAEAANATKN